MALEKPFLQPILEDVEMGLEKEQANEQENDNLLSLETYKQFSGDDWFTCCKIIVVLLLIMGLIGMICYIFILTYKKY